MKRLAKHIYRVPWPFLVFQVLWDTQVGGESSFLSTVFHGVVKNSWEVPFQEWPAELLGGAGSVSLSA